MCLKKYGGQKLHVIILFLKCSLKADSFVGGSDVVEKFFGVLADEGFLVVAGHVVPRNAVIVDIVEHAQA